MRYIIVDLEATCWLKGVARSRTEIIEIGAVELDSTGKQTGRAFDCFVKPILEPILSDFCKQLTSIQQADVDSAKTFTQAFPDFLAWIGHDAYALCSWGAYDLNQLRQDCKLHSIPFPPTFELHVNLKRLFAQRHDTKPRGMAAALKILNIPLDGTHHRGIDDARNIAKIASTLMPLL